MIRRTSLTALMSAVALVAGLGAGAAAHAQQTTLRVFSGGAPASESLRLGATSLRSWPLSERT